MSFKRKVKQRLKRKLVFYSCGGIKPVLFFLEITCFRGSVESCFFIPLFHFKGGWVGQRSHRLEVLTPHTNPTSRREGKTPLTRNGQRIAGSPIYVEKRSSSVLSFFRAQ